MRPCCGGGLCAGGCSRNAAGERGVKPQLVAIRAEVADCARIVVPEERFLQRLGWPLDHEREKASRVAREHREQRCSLVPLDVQRQEVDYCGRVLCVQDAVQRSWPQPHGCRSSSTCARFRLAVIAAHDPAERVVILCHVAYAKVKFDGLMRAIRHGGAYDSAGSAPRELLQQARVGVHADASPSKVAFEGSRVRDDNRVVGGEIDKITSLRASECRGDDVILPTLSVPRAGSIGGRADLAGVGAGLRWDAGKCLVPVQDAGEASGGAEHKQHVYAMRSHTQTGRLVCRAGTRVRSLRIVRS
eukprot:7254418-Prymnesium_polylepis.2